MLIKSVAKLVKHIQLWIFELTLKQVGRWRTWKIGKNALLTFFWLIFDTLTGSQPRLPHSSALSLSCLDFSFNFSPQAPYPDASIDFMSLSCSRAERVLCFIFFIFAVHLFSRSFSVQWKFDYFYLLITANHSAWSSENEWMSDELGLYIISPDTKPLSL